MIRIVFIGIYVAFWTGMYAQNEYLLIQKKESIDILSVEDDKTIHLFNNSNELKGYKIDGDSLIVYVSQQTNGGSLKEFKVFNPVSLHQIVNPIEVENFKDSTEFSFGSFSMHRNTELVLYKNKILLWKKNFKPRDFMGLQSEKYYYYDFNVLIKEEQLLCVKSKLRWSTDKKNIIEIDLKTGEEKIISKNCSNPSYSPLGKYILFQESWARTKQKKFILFNRNENRIIEYPNFYEQAFWLHK